MRKTYLLGLLAALAPLGLGAAPAGAEVRVTGSADNVVLQAKGASLQEIVAGLQSALHARISLSGTVPQPVTGVYSGPVRRVLARVLDGVSYVVNSGPDGMTLVIIAPNGARAAPSMSVRPVAAPVPAAAAAAPPTPPAAATGQIQVTTGDKNPGGDTAGSVPVVKPPLKASPATRQRGRSRATATLAPDTGSLAPAAAAETAGAAPEENSGVQGRVPTQDGGTRTAAAPAAATPTATTPAASEKAVPPMIGALQGLMAATDGEADVSAVQGWAPGMDPVKPQRGAQAAQPSASSGP